MSGSHQIEAAAARRRARRARLSRVMRRTLYAKLSIIACLLLVAGVAYLRLIAGPVSLNDYTKEVGDALAARIGPGWRVAFNDAALELHGVTPAVRAAGLEIRNPGGVVVVRAPLALVSLDPVTLLTGNVALKAIELRDLQIRALVARDGSLRFVPQDDSEPAPAPAPDPTTPAPVGAEGSPVSQALASLLQPILSPNGVVGALDRAVVTNARVTLIGADGRERVGFSRVGARFEQLAAGKREISVDLEGPHGAWHIGGTAQNDGGGVQSVQLAVAEVPLADTLLLAGLSGLPDGSDLKLSAEVSASLDGRHLTDFGGRFWSSKGVIELPDKNLRFLHVEQLAGSAKWDEAKRTLSLSDLVWANGPTQIRLAAELTQGAEPRAWALDFSGHDAVLSGAAETDAPVKIDRIAGRMRFKDNGLTLEGLSLLGPALDASLSGTFDPDKKDLRAELEAQRTGARNLLRLWPETINPDLRRYIAMSLRAGMVDSLHMTTILDEPDLRAAFGSAPVSDGAIKLSASMSNGTLVPAVGMPPLVGLQIEGGATGTTATMRSREARLELPDGRRLKLSEGTYSQVDMTTAGSIAHIGFRMGGGADALAALLRLPQFHDATSFDFDPATVKGNVDLRVNLPLQYDHMPKSAADVAASVVGTISDLTIDKVYGREKLEGANVTLTSDPTGIFVKGDGKISGAPSQIDLHQPRGTPGEIVVNATLDDAARARRSLPSGSQLGGPVAVKVTAALGPGPSGAKPMARVEADLARASVDGLIPGWIKPAGKPGRVSFALGDGDGKELRDFLIDSGSVQVRGSLSMGDDGLEKADFSSLKLSPGDDMRAQIERSGGVYRVALKGNVGDARPLIKQITAGSSTPAPAPPGARTRESEKARDTDKGRDSSDVDLDLALNILTGNNDEAMTAVTSKVSLRKGELRALQFSGRFRGANVDAQLARRDVGAPILTLQTADAGATLRFLDIYKRMLGGKLLLTAAMAPSGQTGTVKIDQFALKNEPALRRIFAQGPPAASEDRGGIQAPQTDADQVYFTKLVGGFDRTASRMEYKDVVIYGAQVGFTLSGFVDNARDRTDIYGTFVPAYGLNNAFSQVPIVGLILGGGNTNEGLFAVDFRISGPASSPTLNVNPLSAVAPGILRKLFGWALQGGGDVPTGTVTPPRSSER